MGTASRSDDTCAGPGAAPGDLDRNGLCWLAGDRWVMGRRSVTGCSTRQEFCMLGETAGAADSVGTDKDAPNGLSLSTPLAVGTVASATKALSLRQTCEGEEARGNGTALSARVGSDREEVTSLGTELKDR